MLSKNAIEHYLYPLSPLPTSINACGSIDETLHGIIFDIYGTLFISASGDIHEMNVRGDQLNSIDLLLKKYQIDLKADRVIDIYLETISEEHTTFHRKGIDFPEIQIDRIWAKITGISEEYIRNFATEFELIINPVSPMPYLEDVIAACRKSGLLMGIISNAQFFTEYLFFWFLGAAPQDLGFHREMIFYSYLSKHAKPSTYMFQCAANRLKEKNISESTVLYVGNDMLKDILPAKQVGFKTALFAGDARSLKLRDTEPDCKYLKPDIIVTDLIQIIDHI